MTQHSVKVSQETLQDLFDLKSEPKATYETVIRGLLDTNTAHEDCPKPRRRKGESL